MTERETGATVTVTRDGPYIVEGNVPLQTQIIGTDLGGESERWLQGGNWPVKKRYALCRCGQSNTKPFCDGTHAAIGFDGTETASRDSYSGQASTFEESSMTLMDAQSLCAFARFCDAGEKVWEQVARTDDPGTRSSFLQKVNSCPSGRLAALDKGSAKLVETPLPVSIGLIEDPQEGCSGPIWLRGGIALISAGGFAYEVRNRMTLCRCGASKNKPFCDGAHATIGFRASSGLTPTTSV